MSSYILDLLRHSINVDSFYVENNFDKKNKIIIAQTEQNAILQNELSKSCQFIIPISKSYKGDDELYVTECGVPDETLEKVSEFHLADFYQYLLMIKSLYDVYNTVPTYKSIELYKSKSKNVLIEKIDHSQYSINTNKLYIAFNSNFVHFMLNYVVVLQYNQPSDETLLKELYIYGLYLICKESKMYYSSVLSGFGEDLKHQMDIALEYNDPSILIERLILSEYPTLDRFIENSFIPAFFNVSQSPGNSYNPNSKLSLIDQDMRKFRFNKSIGKENTYTIPLLNEFQNSLTNNIKVNQQDVENYLNLVEKGLNFYFDSHEDFLNMGHIAYFYTYDYYNLYKFPIIFEDDRVNKEIVSTYYPTLSHIYKNLKIFFNISQVLKTKPELQKLDLYYHLKKICFFELKQIYYSITVSELKNGLESSIYSHHLGNDVNTYIKALFDSVGKDYTLNYQQPPQDNSKIMYLPPSALYQHSVLYSRDKERLITLILKIVFYNKNKGMNAKKIENVLNKNKNDYNNFLDFQKLRKAAGPSEDVDVGSLRASLRVKDMNNFRFFSFLKENLPSKSMSYLDFGGGIGEITIGIVNELKKYGFILNKKDVFVSDITEWFGQSRVEEYSKIITYRYLKSSTIPFEENSLDFVSAFQVLHHVNNIKITLLEIHSILKPTGFLLIREHDCENDLDRMLIDTEHSLHEMIDVGLNKTYLHNYEDGYKYLSKKELFDLLTASGFEYVQLKDDFYNQSKGVTKYYYSIWKPIKVFIQEPEDEEDTVVQEIKPQTMTDEDIKDIEEYMSQLQISVDPSLLEKEITRKEIYQSIISNLKKTLIPYFKSSKDIDFLLLRYIFSKNSCFPNSQEPVLIPGVCKPAEDQLNKDFIHFNIKLPPKNYIKIIEDSITAGLKKLNDVSLGFSGARIPEPRKSLDIDFSVTENGKYKYKNIIVDDFGNLISSQTDKNKQKLLIAASMRYKYMNIGTHGLALDYASIGFKPTDAVTEGFGGVFNHYFDNFCSAFPDLEAPFGSIGNFFSVEQFPTKVVHVNPPYDETVMTQVVKRVRYMLDKDPSYTFVLTFPDWPNFKAKDDISKDSRTYKVKRFDKGDLIFIDYFEGKRIAPVKIIMIYIGNDKHFIPEF
jgi:ubiquinone/menaquinone biosynthesis C-methylase UbiE